MKCITGNRVGTCNSADCPSHGLCHCDCGSEMKIATHNHQAEVQYPCGIVKGMPYMHRTGHTAQSRRNLSDPRFYRLNWYVDAAQARDLIEMLVNEYGTLSEVSRRVGLSRDTLVRIRHRRINKLWPQTLAKLGQAWANTDSLPATYLPFAPLAHHEIDDHGLCRRDPACMACRQAPEDPRLQRAWFRARREGRITITMADDIATYMGLPTAYLYGDLWFEDVSA